MMNVSNEKSDPNASLLRFEYAKNTSKLIPAASPTSSPLEPHPHLFPSKEKPGTPSPNETASKLDFNKDISNVKNPSNDDSTRPHNVAPESFLDLETTMYEKEEDVHHNHNNNNQRKLPGDEDSSAQQSVSASWSSTQTDSDDLKKDEGDDPTDGDSADPSDEKSGADQSIISEADRNADEEDRDKKKKQARGDRVESDESVQADPVSLLSIRLTGSSSNSPYAPSDFVFFAESDRPCTPGGFMAGMDDGFDYDFALSAKSGVVQPNEGMFRDTLDDEHPPTTSASDPSVMNAEIAGGWAPTEVMIAQACDDPSMGAEPQYAEETSYMDPTSSLLLPYPEWVERQYKPEVQMTQYGYITPPPPIRTPPFRRQNPDEVSADKKKNRKNRNEEKKQRMRQRANPQEGPANLYNLNTDLQQSLAALTQLTSTLQQFGLNGLTLSSLLSAAAANPNGMGNPNATQNLLGQLANLGYSGLLYNPLMVPTASTANSPIGALTQALQHHYLLALHSQLLNQQIMQQGPPATDPMGIPVEYLDLNYNMGHVPGTPSPNMPMNGVPQPVFPIPSPHDVAEIMSQQSAALNRTDGMSPPIMQNGYHRMVPGLPGQGGAPTGGQAFRLPPELEERKQRVPEPPPVSIVQEDADSIDVLGLDSMSDNVELDGDVDWNCLIDDRFTPFSDARIQLRRNPHRGVVYGPSGSEENASANYTPRYDDDFSLLPSVPQVDSATSPFGLQTLRTNGEYDVGGGRGAAEFDLNWQDGSNWDSTRRNENRCRRKSRGGGSANSGSIEEFGGYDGSTTGPNNEMDGMSGGARNAPNRREASPPLHQMNRINSAVESTSSSTVPIGVSSSMKKRSMAGTGTGSGNSNWKGNRNRSEQQQQLFNQSMKMKCQVASAARDANGCRTLQQLLDKRNAAVFYMIYTEVLPVLADIMSDRHGKYLCQKLVDYCAQEQRVEMLRSIENEMVMLSQDVHATRVIQKLISCVESEKECGIIAASLSKSVALLAKDLHGSNVIQLLLRYLKAPEACEDERCSNQFVFIELCVNLRTIATNKHGCCVLQRCLSDGTESQVDQVAKAIVDHVYELSQDAFGNYVVQKYISSNLRLLGTGELIIDAVYKQLRGQLTILSIQKFSSNVVEHCLVSSSPNTKRLVIDELMQDKSIRKLVHDRYGNYVIQRVLDVADGEMELHQLIDRVRPHVQALGDTEIGQRIQKTFVCRFPQLADRNSNASFLSANATAFHSMGVRSNIGGGGVSGSTVFSSSSHGHAVPHGSNYENFVDHTQHGGMSVSSPTHLHMGLGHDSMMQRNSYEQQQASSGLFGAGMASGMNLGAIGVAAIDSHAMLADNGAHGYSTVPRGAMNVYPDVSEFGQGHGHFSSSTGHPYTGIGGYAQQTGDHHIHYQHHPVSTHFHQQQQQQYHGNYPYTFGGSMPDHYELLAHYDMFNNGMDTQMNHHER